jgi:hypothetical protein
MMYSYYTGLPIFWTLPVVQYSKITQRFGNWTCPRYQVKCKETSAQKGHLERAHLNHWTCQTRSSL